MTDDARPRPAGTDDGASPSAQPAAEQPVDDVELLRRYAETKSQEAFAELVRRHLGLVYHAALRQVGGDVHRAQDVAQTVFADLARKADAVARRSVPVGWLYTSTRYAAAMAVRA